MRYKVTVFGLLVAFLATGCGSKNDDGPETKSVLAKPAPGPTCGEVADQPPTDAVWIAQLPAIIRFKFHEDPKEGVVAEPVCVRDRAHTPDWDDVVTSQGLFGRALDVTYGRSRRQLEDQSRYAKLQVLELTQSRRSWSGKIREVLKDQSLWSGVLEYFGPIEDEIELPICTEAEMEQSVDVPAASAVTAPETPKTECH